MKQQSYEQAVLDGYVGSLEGRNPIEVAANDYRIPVLLDLIFDQDVLTLKSQCAIDSAIETITDLCSEVAHTYGIGPDGIDSALKIANEEAR